MSAPPSEARMVQLLQDALKPIQDRLDDLIETQAESEAEHEYFHSAINQLNTDNKDLQERLVVLERENKILKERLINQEAYSRRNNLCFHGMAESKFDNAEEKVLHYLHSHGLNFHRVVLKELTVLEHIQVGKQDQLEALRESRPP